MPSDTHKFVIRAYCTPTCEHVRRFNAPTFNDAAVIIVGDPTKSGDIVVQRRSNIMHRVNETHHLYDAIQYPINWQGQDGYDITLKMVDPITGLSTNTNLSAMNYYAYHMMIRSHWDLTLADSVISSNAYQMRTLQLWNKYKDDICEDILHRLRIQTNNPDIQITYKIYNEGLFPIEDQCLTIANKLLIEVGMIVPNRSMHDTFNQELNRELQYNVDTCAK
ncbi:uncharacterized protein LOC142227601 [Haematobia irritans]|uniref:uncharacterized protein LOC142227601 n=1 Tax=Haematobia irritans TaxID=7368 RepID=UPI003F4F9192